MLSSRSSESDPTTGPSWVGRVVPSPSTALEMLASKRYAVLSFMLRSFVRRGYYQSAGVAGDHEVLVGGYHPDGHRAAVAGDDGCVFRVAARIEPQAEELQALADMPSYSCCVLPDPASED